MKREIDVTTQYKKDYKLVMKRNKNMDKLDTVVDKLADDIELPESNKDHKLTGMGNKRECHIAPNWLLVYEKKDDLLILYQTGSHSDLFK